MRVALLVAAALLGFSACGGGEEEAAPPAETVASPLPGGTAYAVCGGETSFIPQYALAAGFDSLWVACRTQGEVLRVDAETGAVLARIPAQGAVALAADETSVWAVWREQGKLYRIDPETNEVAATLSLNRDTPYIWAEAGAVWAGYGGGNTIGRVDPELMKVVGSVEVGDGTSDIVADGDTLLVICHRDSTLWRLDPETNTAEQLSVLPGDTPERLTLAAGSLWATGRGTDLLRIDPATGETLETIELGVGAIELAAVDGAVWVAVAEAEADRQGLPVLEQLVSVDPETGAVGELVTPSGQLHVTGLAADGAALWLADVVGGRLVRVG